MATAAADAAWRALPKARPPQCPSANRSLTSTTLRLRLSAKKGQRRRHAAQANNLSLRSLIRPPRKLSIVLASLQSTQAIASIPGTFLFGFPHPPHFLLTLP